MFTARQQRAAHATNAGGGCRCGTCITSCSSSRTPPPHTQSLSLSHSLFAPISTLLIFSFFRCFFLFPSNQCIYKPSQFKNFVRRLRQPPPPARLSPRPQLRACHQPSPLQTLRFPRITQLPTAHLKGISIRGEVIVSRPIVRDQPRPTATDRDRPRPTATDRVRPRPTATDRYQPPTS